LNIAVPAVLSNALLRKMAVDWGYRKPARMLDSRAALQRHLLKCTFAAHLEISGMRVPMSELTDLQTGKVLRFNRAVDSPAVLFLAGTEMLRVRLARSGQARAAQVLDWLGASSERSAS
jgi:flagellar motor switch protein FliM